MDDPELRTDAAERMLDKLRGFVAGLEPEERSLFAALVAPGIAAAWTGEDVEVEGFGAAWSATQVHEHLRRAIRRQDVRIEGL